MLSSSLLNVHPIQLKSHWSDAMKKIWVLASLLGTCLAACRETKLEPSKPSSIRSETSEDAQAADEKVSPPVPITGAWLTASVMEETSNNSKAQTRIGIGSFYNAIKITSDRDRFRVTFNVASAANGLVISAAAVGTGDYDQIVTIQGSSLPQIRAAFANIDLELTVLDRQDNTSNSTSISLAKALEEVRSKSVVKSSSSASTSTGSGS